MPVGIFGKDIVNYRSTKEGADKVVADIRADGGRAIAVRADVGKSAEVQALFERGEEGVWENGRPSEQRGRLQVRPDPRQTILSIASFISRRLTAMMAMQLLGEHATQFIKISRHHVAWAR